MKTTPAPPPAGQEFFLDSFAEDVRRLREPALLTGDRGVFELTHILLSRLALGGARLHIVDCAIRFRLFQISEECLAAGMDPEPVLKRILIQRGFTPYQILQIARQILSRPPAPADPPVYYFILSPYKQFFDGDVAREESAYLLRLLNRHIRYFRQRGIPLICAEKDHYSHENFAPAFRELKTISGTVWRINAPTARDQAGLPGFQITTGEK